MNRKQRASTGGRKKRAAPPDELRSSLVDAAESEPIWGEWLALTPGERLVRAWELRKLLPDPEAAHDARSLPGL